MVKVENFENGRVMIYIPLIGVIQQEIFMHHMVGCVIKNFGIRVELHGVLLHHTNLLLDTNIET